MMYQIQKNKINMLYETHGFFDNVDDLLQQIYNFVKKQIYKQKNKGKNQGYGNALKNGQENGFSKK